MTLSLLQTCQHTPKRKLIKILLLVAIGVCLLLFQLCVHLLTLVKVDTALSDSQPLLQDDGNLEYLHYHSTQSSHKGLLPLCPRIPPGLKGRIRPSLEKPSFEEIKHNNWDLSAGGSWRPRNCTSRHRVAIIIPFRDRYEHLRILLDNIHPILKRQQLDYSIYVIEQAMPTRFNRAILLNIGFTEAMKQYDYQCVIFHDVDLVPEDDRNLYSCPSRPRHMSSGVDILGYRLPYDAIFGGVTALRKEHFEMVNGYSNIFFGWGGEDDDMSSRLKHHNLTISRYPQRVARYKMLSHHKGPENPNRFKYLFASEGRFNKDGLNSLKYRVIRIEKRPTYTWVYVNVNQKLIMQPWADLMKLKIIPATRIKETT